MVHRARLACRRPDRGWMGTGARARCCRCVWPERVRVRAQRVPGRRSRVLRSREAPHRGGLCRLGGAFGGHHAKNSGKLAKKPRFSVGFLRWRGILNRTKHRVAIRSSRSPSSEAWKCFSADTGVCRCLKNLRKTSIFWQNVAYFLHGAHGGVRLVWFWLTFPDRAHVSGRAVASGQRGRLCPGARSAACMGCGCQSKALGRLSPNASRFSVRRGCGGRRLPRGFTFSGLVARCGAIQEASGGAGTACWRTRRGRGGFSPRASVPGCGRSCPCSMRLISLCW